MQLRSLATSTAWRLSNQPVSLLIDETTTRVKKAERRAGEWAAAERGSLAIAMAQDDWDEEAEYEDYDEPARKRHLLRLWLAAPDFDDGDEQLRRGISELPQ